MFTDDDAERMKVDILSFAKNKYLMDLWTDNQVD